MSSQLDALRLFVLIARMDSSSRVAREVRISQATASRMISKLERRLGVTLVTWSTRTVALTERGSRYVAEIELILTALDRDNALGQTSELTAR